MKLLIHSQTSTVSPLKFGNGQVMSSHSLPGMYISMLRLKFQPVSKRGPIYPGDVLCRMALFIHAIDTHSWSQSLYLSYILFEDPCPVQFSYVPGALKCYLTSEKQAYTWQQADAECKSRDSSLVALETQEEFDATKEWYMGSEFYSVKI